MNIYKLIRINENKTKWKRFDLISLINQKEKINHKKLIKHALKLRYNW